MVGVNPIQGIFYILTHIHTSIIDCIGGAVIVKTTAVLEDSGSNPRSDHNVYVITASVAQW